MKYQTIIMMFLIGLLLIGIVKSEQKHQAEIQQVKDEYLEAMTSEYNRGYRYGRFDAVAELVECYSLRDDTLLLRYMQGGQILAEAGELENEPYPCE